VPLSGYESVCQPHAPIIVSKEKGRSHIAHNNDYKLVNHYHIDGVVITQGHKCDYLLINEKDKIAYLIELKGDDLSWAAQQLEATEQTLHSQLPQARQYRIVASRCKTQEIESTKFRKYRHKWGKKLKYQTNQMDELI